MRFWASTGKNDGKWGGVEGPIVRRTMGFRLPQGSPSSTYDGPGGRLRRLFPLWIQTSRRLRAVFTYRVVSTSQAGPRTYALLVWPQGASTNLPDFHKQSTIWCIPYHSENMAHSLLVGFTANACSYPHPVACMSHTHAPCSSCPTPMHTHPCMSHMHACYTHAYMSHTCNL
jgi:hypothetical protein